jgi:hypothetical protein
MKYVLCFLCGILYFVLPVLFPGLHSIAWHNAVCDVSWNAVVIVVLLITSMKLGD